MCRVAAGELELFDELVGRHHRQAWRLAFRWLGDPSDAEDVVQSAFLKILRAAPHYRATAAFQTYLYRVVTRLCIDHTRKRRPDSSSELSEPADPSPGAEHDLESREVASRVVAALAKLPLRQCAAVVLKHFEELSYDEIARVLEVSVKAVERLLARGRAALRVHLRDLDT